MSQQFEQIKEAMKDLKSEYKNAIHAGIASVVYFVLYLLEWNLFSFILTKLMFGLVFMIFRHKVLGVQMKFCECLQEESISKNYFNLHDKLNKWGDFFRHIILLEDLYSLSKIVIVWFFMITIGGQFSTIATILITIDMLVVIQIARTNEKVDELRQTGKQLLNSFVLARIPKYTEEKEKSS
jgi:hypothetical protein